MKRRKLLALLGAAVLTLGTVGVAFANTLSEDKPNMVDPTTLDELISDEGVDEDCSDFVGDLEVGDGEVGIHFILTQPESNSGNISGSVDGVPFGPVAGIFHGNSENGALHFYVIVAGDGSSVIDDATTDVDGNILTVSHLCFGDEVTTTTTDETTTTTDETTTTTDETTTTTSFTGGEQELTEPPTDAFGTNGQSNPANSAWLLVVALGALLASLVILSPAKSRR